MSLPIPSITLPLPSITPDPSSNPGDSSTPGPEPSDPPSSSGGGSSVNPSSGGSSGGGSSGGPSSSGGGSSSAEPSSSEESSTETTLSETSTSVFESLSVITSDGRTLTTSVLVTTIVEPGTVITAPAHTGGASANVGAIVGGVIGGLVGLVALVGLIFFLLKRRRKNFDKEFDGNFDPDYVSKHNTGGPLAFTTAGGAALATATGAHRKSHSLEKAGRQRVNLNNADRASLEAAALAEDDGMGGRLDASTVGGGIVTPFPFPQGQGGPQGGYSGHQTPYNPAMSPPPMSMNSLPPASPPSGPNMGLAGMGAAGAAGYYAGHHQQQGHHGQQGYGYGQQPYGGQGYPDRHGAISPSTTDHSYPNSANPYLAGAPSSNGHGGAYGGYVDPSNQSVYGGVAPSVTGTSASGYGPPPHAGTFGGAGAAMSSAASTHSSAGTGGPAGALSYTTGSGAMSAKEREARGMRPTGGLGVVNPDERPENRRAEGSAGSVLPSPFDAALGGGGGKAAEANANARNGQSGLIVHQDGGRVRQEEDESAPGEIPPAYDSVLYGK